MKTYRNITLVPVGSNDKVIFSTAIEKQLFADTHEGFEYTFSIDGNYAYLHKYMCIDTEGEGFVLNKRGLTYRECVNLINQYL